MMSEAEEYYFEKCKELEAQLGKCVEAFNKLARLGNGEHIGNSDGNVIAANMLMTLPKQAHLDAEILRCVEIWAESEGWVGENANTTRCSSDPCTICDLGEAVRAKKEG